MKYINKKTVIAILLVVGAILLMHFYRPTKDYPPKNWAVFILPDGTVYPQYAIDSIPADAWDEASGTGLKVVAFGDACEKNVVASSQYDWRVVRKPLWVVFVSFLSGDSKCFDSDILYEYLSLKDRNGYLSCAAQNIKEPVGSGVRSPFDARNRSGVGSGLKLTPKKEAVGSGLRLTPEKKATDYKTTP